MSPEEVGQLTGEAYANHVAMAEFILNVLRAENTPVNTGKALVPYRTNFSINLDMLLDPTKAAQVQAERAKQNQNQLDRKGKLKQQHMRIIQEDLGQEVFKDFGIVDNDENQTS